MWIAPRARVTHAESLVAAVGTDHVLVLCWDKSARRVMKYTVPVVAFCAPGQSAEPWSTTEARCALVAEHPDIVSSLLERVQRATPPV